MYEEFEFAWRGKRCTIEVDYAPNSGPDASGFSIFHDMPFDLEQCKGYPTMHARVNAANLRGYERYCGWIQLVSRRDYATKDSIAVESFDLDCDEEMRKHGLPYFAFGYPAELFDAPCKNLGSSARLEWRARTYLVEMPVYRVNGRQMKFLAGFSWGYTEGRDEEVKMLALNRLTEEDWLKDRPLLQTSNACE